MAERVNLIQKLFKANPNNARGKRCKMRRKQRNKVQNKRRNINARSQVLKALQPFTSTKESTDFHVTKKRLTKPLRANFPSLDIFKEPLHQASEGFCNRELKFIHESRQPSEDRKSFMAVSPIRSVANRAKSKWSSFVDSPSHEPSLQILEVSKSDEDDAADFYRRFVPKATSTVQQEKASVLEGAYPDFASGVTKGVLDEVGGYLALGYFADTKSFLQEVYKESCKRKQPEDLIEKGNMESVDIQTNEMKAEQLGTMTVSPPLARTRGHKMSLNSHRHANLSFNFTTPNLFTNTVDLENSPEVIRTPGASLSTSLGFLPVDTVTLNADEPLKEYSSKGRNASAFDGNDEGYTSSLSTTEFRCSHAYRYSKLHNYASHQPNAIVDTGGFHCNNEIREYCVGEQDGLIPRKRTRLPEVQHDFSLMAYNDMSVALQIPVKYKHEDAISLPCSHCRGRGIQIIPINPIPSNFAIKNCLKSTTPDIKFFPRKTYRENT